MANQQLNSERLEQDSFSTDNGGTMIVELETVPEQESIFQILQLGAVPDQGA